jgi:predicted dehydrogenase
MKKIESSRRQFLKYAGLAGAGIMGLPGSAPSSSHKYSSISRMPEKNHFGANDQVQIALIGAGGMGVTDALTALEIEGVSLVAVCDLYDGRLESAKEMWGKEIFITKDYREILQRDDVDAVIIATPDHWHKQISVDALSSGKSVYCEKPMIHSVDEGPEVIKAQEKSGRVLEVGSQGLSSLGNEKARDLLAAGGIGQLNYAEGFWARNSPVGAWQYPIPEDASADTVDWDRYIANTVKRQFDPLRFFRWRNYRDYGTGMSGDLFVHLFSSLHFITGSNGPDKIYASGGLRFWRDGREVPDVLIGVFDYPESRQHPAFNLSLRCNFVDGTSGSTYLRLVGNEGALDVMWDKVILKHNAVTPSEDPVLKTKSGGKPFRPESPQDMNSEIHQETVYQAASDYRGAHYDHFSRFFQAVRHNMPLIEDAVFGYRACAPALLCNDSYFNDQIIHWDPIQMKLKTAERGPL